MIPEFQNPNTSVFYEPSISGAYHSVDQYLKDNRTIQNIQLVIQLLNIQQIQQHWPAISGRMFWSPWKPTERTIQSVNQKHTYFLKM